jgi:Tfp pilus assembly protein PilV
VSATAGAAARQGPGLTTGRGRPQGRRAGDESGFGLIEVVVATLVLVVVVISLGNLLADSLTAAALSRQRDDAASLAGDVVENAKALGDSQLADVPAGSSPCVVVAASAGPVPVLTGGANGNFQQCFTTTIGVTAFTVTPLVTPVSGGPDTVTVTVTWAGGAHSYLTTTEIGA